MTRCSDIGRSDIQRAFIVLEDMPGEIACPEPRHAIAIINDATANQTPEFSDSKEKLGSRDVTRQLPEAMPAGEAEISMYLRCPAVERVTAGYQAMQGYDALLSLFGDVVGTGQVVVTLAQAGAADTTLTVLDVLNGATLPPAGVLKVNQEKIFYAGVSEDGRTLLDCVRGHDGTTAAAITEDDLAEYASICFCQAKCNPSFTLWLQTDHFLQGLTGCTINEAEFSLSNEGGVEVNFSSIQGMQMVFAGTGRTTSKVTAGSHVIPVENAKLFTDKVKIWNETMEDDNFEQGYVIESVDEAAGTITLASGISKDWPGESVIAGFLPANPADSGEILKGGDTDFYLDGVAGAIRNSSLKYVNNIHYITDEVGMTYPRDYVEKKREVTMEMTCYFRAADAANFKGGYTGTFMSCRIGFGRGRVLLYMPRLQQTMPSVSVDDATVTLDMTGTALGTGDGNNSLYMIFN